MKKTLICVILMSAVPNAWATLNVVANGGFEAGLDGWTWTPTEFADDMDPTVVPSAGVFGTAGQCFRVNPGTDIDHWGIGQEEGGILSQSINLTGGTEYDVSLGAAAIRDLGGSENADGGLMRLYIGGYLLWSWDVSEIPSGVTLSNSYNGTYTPVSTASYDLELALTRTYTNNPPVVYNYVDRVSVIPEPATICLLGFGSLGLLHRRKSA